MTESVNHRSPHTPWGKLEHDVAGRVVGRQSLSDHSADVAAVLAALISLSGIRSRLSILAGRDVDSVTTSRLAYLTFLHDCGKVNRGFQARVDPRSPIVGHIKPLAALLGRRPAASLREPASDAIGSAALSMWGQRVTDLFDAILSHHGRPWPADEPGVGQARHWLPGPDGDPIALLKDLRLQADKMFPEAHTRGTASLPDNDHFVHSVAGLVQLADWIASSDWRRDVNAAPRDQWASTRIRDIGLDPTQWREALAKRVPTFLELFDVEPYQAQTATQAAAGRLVILESETGSGKTEAALYRFVHLFAHGAVDGLYFALPTRTAAAQIHQRVADFLTRVWGAAPPPSVLAVPGYLADDAAGGLPDAADLLDSPEADTRVARIWAAENPKRYFTALVGVGTVDQALLAALRVKHAHLRGAALMRHLLVVDEVHASDTYMRGLLLQLLKDHLSAGGHALLLSATLGSELRDAYITAASGARPRDLPQLALAEALMRPYPLVSVAEGRRLEAVCSAGARGDKSVEMEELGAIDDPVRIAELALTAAHEGAKVLIIRNSVATAVDTQCALERVTNPSDDCLFRVAGRPALHHGRFAREDRLALDRGVQSVVGKERRVGGIVVVGTQTLEQSLDIDADLLITDLCPVDVLLQRLGRLHRHDRSGIHARPRRYAEPRALVLVPGGGLSPFLGTRRKGRRHGLGFSLIGRELRGVYPDLVTLEATRRLLASNPVWRIPTLNRLLVESALHSESRQALIDSFPTDQRVMWVRHATELEGHVIGLGQIAGMSVLRRDAPFMEQGVVDDMVVATRLGGRDRLVDLPRGTAGPFGWNIGRLNVPHWMMRDVVADELPAVVLAPGGSILIRWTDATLIYDRLGLRPEAAHDPV